MPIATVPNPFEDSRRIGTVTAVQPSVAFANVPHASGTPLHHYGARLGRGEVGEYVAIPHCDIMVLGRIVEVRLPERDRLKVEPRIGDQPSADPISKIALLTDVDLAEERVTGAVFAPPRVGSPVYAVTASLLETVVSWSTATKTDRSAGPPIMVELGRLPGAHNHKVRMSPERLFERHCAVLGTTGGGKSYTVARLIESCAKHHCKIILLDATGEFYKLPIDSTMHVSIGQELDLGGGGSINAEEVVFPHADLNEADLFALFTPSGQTQAPILREAIRSLKLAGCVAREPDRWPDVELEGGCITKSQRRRAPLEQAMSDCASVIESPGCPFDALKLARQMDLECVFATGGTQRDPDESKYGGMNGSMQANCATLRLRVEGMVTSASFECVFGDNAGKKAVASAVDEFLSNDAKRVLRISMRYLPFARDVRPVIANAIGRDLLRLARDGRFRPLPVVVFLDEAHQFLDRSIGDESNRFRLDSFDIVAKEGRKYGLTLCLATQRPRDIHESVLSQIGTLIVHRLSHPTDRDVVERSARDIEQSAAAFLPTLAPGEALIIGGGMPIPIPVWMDMPSAEPDSRGPNYQATWRPSPASPAP